MNKSLKGALASSIVALSIATGLQAVMQYEDCKRCEKDCFAFSFPKDVNLCNPHDVYFYVTGLAMQASEGGLEWGVQTNSGATILPITGGRVLGFESWNYNPGVRVGLGGYIDHDAWNLEANWTWVHFSNYHEHAATGNNFILPTFLAGADDQAASIGQFANGGWNGQYNVLDAWMGKPYHVSRYFVMNPVLGGRLAFIDQNFDVGYAGLNRINRANVDIKNNFWGVGIRAGLNMDWVITPSWKFFGTFAASMLRGHFAVNQKYTAVSLGADSINGNRLNQHFWDTVPALETSLGIQCGRHFNCDRNYIGVRLAYEFTEWFDQFQARKIYSVSTVNAGQEALRTNFTLSGFSFAVQVDF